MTSTANVANETSSCYLAENFNQNNDERNVNVENNSKTNSRVDPVTASVTNRKWIKTPYGSNFHPRHNAHIFKLMSYNILSQDLLNIHSDLYIENDPNALKWEHRLKCLTHEILSVEPDILCLQEVQYTHLNDIVEALRPLNFAEPLYKRRNGPQVDGCAIFYNKTMFKLLDRHYVEYYQPNVEILDRYNVAVIVKLALASKPDCEFVVSTTHLLYNPRRDDIRLAQVQVLLAELDRLSYHTKKSSPLPIILTGDFNFQSCSEAYQLITSGSVKLHYNYNRDCVHRLLPDILGITDNCQHLNVAVKNQRDQTLLYASDNEKIRDGLSPEEMTPISLEFASQPFNSGIISHYLNLTPTLDYPHLASTFHKAWITVDYIFYTKFKRRSSPRQPFQYSSLQLLANYMLPTKRKCLGRGPIPNTFLGSDHYSMAAQFVLFENR